MERNKIFYSSWFAFWFGGVGGSAALLILGYADHGFIWDFYTQVALFAAGILLLSFIWDRYHIYVQIIDGRHFINAGARSFIKDKVELRDIKCIARAGSPTKWWGSLMIMFGPQTNKQVRLTFLREKAYDDETIKALLRELKRLNPSIELDEEYEQFLNTPPDGMWLSENPAKRMVPEVEAKMEARFS
jgi:hypothetical protein